jgi:hypothetical protein
LIEFGKLMLISLFVCHVITCLWAFVGLLGIECEGFAQCEALTREAEKRCTKGDLNCTNDLSVGLFESIGQGWTLSYKYIYWCSSALTGSFSTACTNPHNVQRTI